MARYIDAEKIKFIGDVWYDDKNNVLVTLEDVKRAIAQTPNADAVDVRRGKWKRKENTKVFWYACSLCGEKVPKNEHGYDYFSDYCPNCGAKMGDKE